MTGIPRSGNRARCQFANCDKFAQTRGLCKAHGGGSRCRDPACNKLAQSRGLCIAHGGGRRCQQDGCIRLAQSKGYCISHGGGRRCIVTNCEKFSQVRGRCKSHSKLTAVTSQSSPSVSTKFSIDFLVNPLSLRNTVCDNANPQQSAVDHHDHMDQNVSLSRVSRRGSVEEVVDPYRRIPEMVPREDIRRHPIHTITGPNDSALPSHLTLHFGHYNHRSFSPESYVKQPQLPQRRSLLSFLDTHRPTPSSVPMMMPPPHPPLVLPSLGQHL